MWGSCNKDAWLFHTDVIKMAIFTCEKENMRVFQAFDEIMLYAHFRNWVPDWHIAKEIYKHFPNSYSVLLPFAYTYLEELIRSTTSEYGIEIYDENGKSKKEELEKV